MEKSIKKVFESIDRERLTSLARELIKIPSENPPGSEKAVGELIYEELTKIGFKTEKIEAVEGRPNIVGVLRGTSGSPSLLLCGHSDVVPAGKGWSFDPYGATIIEGRLYGRGAADMKGGLAAIIEAARAIQRSRINLKGDLIVAVTVDEEAGGDKGMGYLVKNKFIEADMAVVCEPSDFKLVVAEEGVLWLEFTVLGKTVHTLFWEEGINAIEKMCKLILKLNELRDRFQTLKHEFIGSPIISIGTIDGGTKTNMVPDTCKITVDMRLIPTQRIQDVLSEIERLIDELKNEDPDLKVNVNPLLSIESFESPKDSEIVKLVRLATKEVIGKEPDFWRKTTTGEDSDMLWLVKYGSIPSVYFGPGKMEQAHATDEHIKIEDLTNAAKIYAHIILNALGKS